MGLGPRFAHSGPSWAAFSGTMYATHDPGLQQYEVGRNVLRTLDFGARGVVVPMRYSLPVKLGNVEPGLVFVDHSGTEVEKRNNSLVSVLTQGVDDVFADNVLLGTPGDGRRYRKVLFIGHNTGGAAETRDLGQLLLTCFSVMRGLRAPPSLV